MSNTLNITLGPMGSGKTTHLTQEANRLADFGFKVLVVGSKKDTRAHTAISSHNTSISLSNSKLHYRSVNKLSDLDASSYEFIFIDEAHFYSDLYETSLKWFLENKLSLYIYGIDGDCDQKPIGDILKLIPYVNGTLLKLKNVCKACILASKSLQYSSATYTILKGEDNRIGQYQQGGLEDTYEAVCLEHLLNYKKTNTKV